MIEFKQQLITPTIAAQYLEASKGNRIIRLPAVKRYADDMINGRWKEGTGEVIKISKTGVILDGHHRLKSVIMANKAIMFHVALNLDDNVFDVLDTGASRNASDSFRIKGIKQDHTIPSIISMYNFLILGRKYGVQKNHKSTNSLLLDQYLLDENFWQNVGRQSHTWYLSFAKILQPSYIGGFYAFFLKLDKQKAEEFMSQLTTGLGVTNETISMLRNKLMQDKMSAKKMSATYKIALIIKTWNLYVTNKTVKVLKYDSLNEKFPTAI